MNKDIVILTDNKIENLVFEGGGVKGIAYGGALEALECYKKLSDVKRVAGTSAGAITASLLALGYSPKEITKIISETNFSSFEDDSFGIIQDTYRLVKNYGWHKGDKFEQWIGSLIEEKLGSDTATFRLLGDKSSTSILGFKKLYVLGTNLSKQRVEIYSHETTPDMPIKKAIRISMSIPGFFRACKNEDGDILVDGGVSMNFPIRLFDEHRYFYEGHSSHEYKLNDRTLGFRTDSKDEIVANKNWNNVAIKINTFNQYISALVTFMMEAANKKHLNKYDYSRTVFIDSGKIKATDFNLHKSDIDVLYNNGKKAVHDFFR